ncbi:unnamed protein product [Didymodactylos carnosus]|uniref:MATH domain-containing protein n=1 Tax=Didymodactylos carnosus TaxID=1234261 RepID=A0A8S2N5M1_9BILA|nr:unnamed protein product [Didymodactylos carnosus]
MVHQQLGSINSSTAVVAKPCECPPCNIKLQNEQQVHRIKRLRSNEQFEDDQLSQTYVILDDCEAEKQGCTSEFQKLIRCISVPERYCKDIPDCESLQHRLSKRSQKCPMPCTHHDTTMLYSDNDSNIGITDESIISPSIAINDLYAEYNKLYEALTILTGGIQTVISDKERLTRELSNLKSSVDFDRQEQLKLKQSEQEQDALINGIQLNQEILQQNLTNLTHHVQSIQSTSYDGTFTWKIKNVAELMMQAQSERQPSIYSPPFYSSPTGYKMCMRAYLNGDGNTRRTHLSLFFVVMRGEYDAILRWPFHFKVTFCMFDQSGQQHHIIDSFRPDVKSDSFQIPKTQMNIASGIPKFFPLSMLQQDGNNYVKDDTLFIKCIVNFTNLPKVLLPYLLTLNPGLPADVQNKMIKTETERRQENQQQPSIPRSTPCG